MVCSQMLFLGSHFVRHFVTLNDVFRMANIDLWIQRPWNRVKRYVGLNTNKMPLDSLNDDFFKKYIVVVGSEICVSVYFFGQLCRFVRTYLSTHLFLYMNVKPRR